MKPEEFKVLSKTDQRVVIAQDVINQIRAKKYIPREGNYMYMDNVYIHKEDSIQKNFGKIRECKVCALGSSILSITKYKNKISFSDIGTSESDFSDDAHTLLKSVFSTRQLALIEGSFEEEANNNYTDLREGYSLSAKDKTKCMNFYNRYDDSKDRLIAIMKNIIANSGEFRP